MTYLNNEKHETFLTHAIIQEGRFFITYADHGDYGSSRLRIKTTGLFEDFEEAKVFLGIWTKDKPSTNTSINSIVHRYRSKQTKDISFDLDVILYLGI